MGVLSDILDSIDLDLGIKKNEEGKVNLSLKLQAKVDEKKKVNEEVIKKIAEIDPTIAAGGKILLDTLPNDESDE